jgi:hypothetical protein
MGRGERGRQGQQQCRNFFKACVCVCGLVVYIFIIKLVSDFASARELKEWGGGETRDPTIYLKKKT